MRQTPERAAYKAMQRALWAVVEVEGMGQTASKLATIMDEWVKRYSDAKGGK